MATATKMTMKTTTGVKMPALVGHEPAHQRRRKAGRRTLRIDQRQALQDAVHGQCHDDRRNAEHRDPDAVDQADQRRPTASTIGNAQIKGPVLSRYAAGKQDAAERDRPWHRQVETSGEDDRALAKRQDQQEGRKHQERVVVDPVTSGHGRSSAGSATSTKKEAHIGR